MKSNSTIITIKCLIININNLGNGQTKLKYYTWYLEMFINYI